MPSASDTSGLCARREDFHVKAAPVRPQFGIRFLTLLIAQPETPAAAWAPLQAESIASRAAPSPRAAPQSSARTAGSTLWPERSSAGQLRDGTASPAPAGHPPLCPHGHRPCHCRTPTQRQVPVTSLATCLTREGGGFVCLCLPLRWVFSLPSHLCLPHTPCSSSTLVFPNLITAQTL